MRAEPERCSARSLAAGESMIGTASTVATWIMLEHPGPWGREALSGSRLPRHGSRTLRSLGVDLRVRIVLIRRHGRHEPRDTTICFLAHAGQARRWMRRVDLDRPEDLFDLDLSPMHEGRPPAVGVDEPGPLFLVCTHGRRDPCCAERGRPVARALDGTYGDRAWEVSHIGGDRFAANLVCFPHGLYFGRADQASAVSVAAAYERGEIDLAKYRGRCSYPFAVQSAEAFVRTSTRMAGVDDLSLAGVERVDVDAVRVTFASSDGGRHSVAVRIRPASTPRTLTCHATRAVRPPTYEQIGEVVSAPLGSP